MKGINLGQIQNRGKRNKNAVFNPAEKRSSKLPYNKIVNSGVLNREWVGFGFAGWRRLKLSKKESKIINWVFSEDALCKILVFHIPQ